MGNSTSLPDPYEPPERREPYDPPPGAARLPRALFLVLVLVSVHALGTAIGGWTLLEENRSRQEHGQDLLMSAGAAWCVALGCWALSALLLLCVVRARQRRPWTRVVLVVSLLVVTPATAFAYVSALAAGGSSPPTLLILVLDVAALWVLLGDTAHRWFSVRRPPAAVPER
ncbi:hypothetical protein [Streptomyces oceani]|uniref:Uncharacterized protein n=1 Tax=Streptomyces oceani TaxID=1075402 RepID=A0A1E7KIW8_9ACTN|nr:hypothetical protein [Streptomyces oceani]OEV03880.1 hypothetical protein AN216_09535 [Streptomyces oceani]